ncbi:hypothetical protein [uncultured Thiothrix sp.]|uniref:hypothetical protein n=1 Tax=uncultured Thiothrix sp. TaxID=223185 RepID=UPI002622C98A|nr:hypothetical protein [uncultured Thiothrix sp.]
MNYSQASEYEDLAMPLLKSVSISWDEAALRQYLPEEIYIKNRTNYSLMLSKSRHLGYINKCKQSLFEKGTTTDQRKTTLKEDCQFQKGQADVLVYFEEINGKNQIIDLSIQANKQGQASTSSSSSKRKSWLSTFKFKSKRKKRSRH